MVAASFDLSWDVVVALALLLGVFVFLAILWSKREWQSRKIRIGLFLEREYQEPKEDIPDDMADTKEWPRRKEE